MNGSAVVIGVTVTGLPIAATMAAAKPCQVVSPLPAK